MTCLIKAQQLQITFPVLNASHRSLKKAVMHAATGGRIARDSGDLVSVMAIDQLNVDIVPGERVALVGHNGCGKTTLLRALAGVYAPTGGQLEVTGSISSLLDISLGMDPEATGVENIFLRGTLMGLNRKDIEQRFDDIAAFADIGPFLNLPVRTYSSGMQMRLGFAVSTSVVTDIVLMDEWLSVGDGVFADKASRRLNELVEDASILVVATHSPALVKQVCNRQLQLQHGKITLDTQLGAPAR